MTASAFRETRTRKLREYFTKTAPVVVILPPCRNEQSKSPPRKLRKTLTTPPRDTIVKRSPFCGRTPEKVKRVRGEPASRKKTFGQLDYPKHFPETNEWVGISIGGGGGGGSHERCPLTTALRGNYPLVRAAGHRILQAIRPPKPRFTAAAPIAAVEFAHAINKNLQSSLGNSRWGGLTANYAFSAWIIYLYVSQSLLCTIQDMQPKFVLLFYRI